jgi:hypothetical protein
LFVLNIGIEAVKSVPTGRENVSYENCSHETSLLFVLSIGLEAVKSVPTGNGAVFQARHKLLQLLHKKHLGLL